VGDSPSGICRLLAASRIGLCGRRTTWIAGASGRPRCRHVCEASKCPRCAPGSPFLSAPCKTCIELTAGDSKQRVSVSRLTVEHETRRPGRAGSANSGCWPLDRSADRRAARGQRRHAKPARGVRRNQPRPSVPDRGGPGDADRANAHRPRVVSWVGGWRSLLPDLRASTQGSISGTNDRGTHSMRRLGMEAASGDTRPGSSGRDRPRARPRARQLDTRVRMPLGASTARGRSTSIRREDGCAARPAFSARHRLDTAAPAVDPGDTRDRRDLRHNTSGSLPGEVRRRAAGASRA
jgi:hypothetical protein